MGQSAEEQSFFKNIVDEMIYNPLNLGLLAVCVFLLYKIFFARNSTADEVPRTPELPPLKKKDMTYQELRQYDGTNEEGRVCVSVNGKIFDCTKGKRFYGPGGPYAAFAGRDATRCLATFSVEEAKDEYDDLSDLNSVQMDKVREWEIQFQERYHYVGRLLRPGEEPTDYSDDEDQSQDQNNLETSSSPESSKKEE